MDVPLLRQQQIRLGLLKAARVLFSQQENLRQIMARPAGSEDEKFSLFQQLLSAATRPSPIKAMFNRNELEVYIYTCIVYYYREEQNVDTIGPDNNVLNIEVSSFQDLYTNV